MRTTIREKKITRKTATTPRLGKSRRQPRASRGGIEEVGQSAGLKKSSSFNDMSSDFSIEDHLRVQNEIERQARELWEWDNFDSSRSLEHWLRAEAQVLLDFCSQRIDRGADRLFA
jgi:hypothetical protein